MTRKPWTLLLVILPANHEQSATTVTIEFETEQLAKTARDEVMYNMKTFWKSFILQTELT